MSNNKKMQVALVSLGCLGVLSCGGQISSPENAKVGDPSEIQPADGGILGDAQEPGFQADGAPTTPIHTEPQELCNQFDDDGDGQVDEDCPCEVGATQPCYPERPTDVIGACQMGQQACQGEAGSEFSAQWGPCQGAVLPQSEFCGDGVDQDCDGADLSCKDLCHTAAQEESANEVFFDNPGGCPWGQGENLSAKAGAAAARTEQVQSLDLPENAVLCGMEFEIPGQDMYYDDWMLVAFDDVVLMSSFNFSQGTLFEQQGDFFYYDWARLKGQGGSLTHSVSGTYCLGQEQGQGTCTLPSTQTNGTMSLTLDPSLVQDLALVALDQKRYEFLVVTTGDDNPPTDCQHTPFTIKVKTYFVRNGSS